MMLRHVLNGLAKRTQHIANRVAKCTQYVVPKNVERCYVEMLRAFGQALTYNRFLQFC